MTQLRTYRSIVSILFALGFGLGVAACNTVDGLGKDISSAGCAMGADCKKK